MGTIGQPDIPQNALTEHAEEIDTSSRHLRRRAIQSNYYHKKPKMTSYQRGIHVL